MNSQPAADQTPPPRDSIACVYIAGPYTARDALAVERNVRRAEGLAYEVARLGAMPVCPHTNLRFASSELAEFLYPATLELMRRCDAAFFTHDWETSRGARDEMVEARRVGLPYFVDTRPTADGLYKLKAWLDARCAGLAAVVGRWPGDESDEQIAAALRDQ